MDMPKPHYVIASVDLKVPFEKHFEVYGFKATEVISRHGGEVLAASTDTQILEGDGLVGTYIVIGKFPSKEAALGFYNDPDYKPLIALRQRETSRAGTVVLVDSLQTIDKAKAIGRVTAFFLKSRLASLLKRTSAKGPEV